jgi:hypothetical protein
LARAKVAANVAFACSSARLTEAGVGWTSSCAPIDCGAIGPAFGFPADWRTACSNCAILLLQGPACATAALRPKAAATSKVAEGRLIARRRMSEHLHDVFNRTLPRFPVRRRPDVRQGSVTSACCRAPSCRLGDNIAFEKIGPARPARPAYGLIALLEAVEAAIIGRGVVEGAPGPVGMGARSGADQEQQRETADQLIHERLLLATSLPKAGFVTLLS